MRNTPEPLSPNTTTSFHHVESPPTESVWSTHRRLHHKQPPGAPKKLKKTKATSSYQLPHTYSYLEPTLPTPSRKRNHDRLLLPSSTIDDDGDDPTPVALSFRPTRLSFSSSYDPTTVILAPSTLWHNTTSWDDDDAVVSPRLFPFGEAKLSRFEAVMVADEDDESDLIFRPRDDEEDDRFPPAADSIWSREDGDEDRD